MIIEGKPKPCSKRQYLYCTAQADIVVFGGAAFNI